ncbi:MAG TPA: hypothetical protein VOA41_17750 [Candidatus Dormibacteraeota bacterium]|nr:hypothetical protein [Candidatus Dormibacteraeota bacterium]
MDTQDERKPIEQASGVSTPIDTSDLIDEEPVTYAMPRPSGEGETADEVSPTPDYESLVKNIGTFPPPRKEAARAAFADWLATPKVRREPKTQGEFSELYGVSETSLSTWKHDPEFHADYVECVKRKFRYRAPDVLNTLTANATLGDIDSVDRFFEATEWNTKKPDAAPATPVTLTLNQMIQQNNEDCSAADLPEWAKKDNSSDGVG